MKRSFADGGITIDAKNRMEYLNLILSYEQQGYDFVEMSDPRSLLYGMLGVAGGNDPIVWLTLACPSTTPNISTLKRRTNQKLEALCTLWNASCSSPIITASTTGIRIKTVASST